MTPDELIEKWLEPDPNRPRLADYRVKDYGTHVWALVGHLHEIAWNVEKAAKDYEMPAEAVDAAIAFYKRHRDTIESRIDEHTWPAA